MWCARHPNTHEAFEWVQVPSAPGPELFKGNFRDPQIMGPPYGKREPYYSHTISIRIPKVVPAYHKGVPLLGVPENPTDVFCPFYCPELYVLPWIGVTGLAPFQY